MEREEKREKYLWMNTTGIKSENNIKKELKKEEEWIRGERRKEEQNHTGET